MSITFHLWFVQLGFLACEVDVDLVFWGLWEDVGASSSVASCYTIAKCTCEPTSKWTFGLGSFALLVLSLLGLLIGV